MLKQYNDKALIRHYEVKNLSQNLKKKKYPSPCFVIEFYPNNENFDSLKHLKNVKELDQIRIYY